MTDTRPMSSKYKAKHGIPVLYKKITARHTAKIVGLLEEHTLPKDEKGYIAYEKGWSDQRIFDEVFADPLYSLAAVETIRAREFGRIRPKMPAGRVQTPPRVVRELEAMDRRIHTLEGVVDSLLDRLKRLEPEDPKGLSMQPSIKLTGRTQ